MTTQVKITLTEPHMYVEVWEDHHNGTSLVKVLTEKGEEHIDYVHQNRELVIKEIRTDKA